MSEIEDPALTIARLLRTKIRVIKDNSALASVSVSGEWQSSDALKGVDGQVTVGVAESVDQKIELTGKIRRKTAALRVNVWATDMPNASENGKTIRGKIVSEVNRVIRQNRTTPNETLYDFVGLGAGGQTQRAFSGDTEAAPSPSWSELSDINYQKLWYSDDDHCQTSQSVNNKYAVLLIRFKLDCRENTVNHLVLGFEGYATAPGGNDVTVKVWNHAAGAWQNSQTGAGSADAAVSITLSSNLPNYIDADGYVWLLARTTNPSNGVTAAVLNCDHASCTATVNGVTYSDVSGYRNLDRIDVKPPIYRTELTVKSWFIENIGV